MCSTKKGKKENFYLYENDMSYISQIAEKNKCVSKSDSLRLILKEHEEFSRLSSKEMYKEIAKNITDNLKNEYGEEVRKSKQHSNNTDKNVQILIEMLNCFIMNNIKENDIVATTDMTKTPILKRAEKEIERRIYENMYKKYGSID